MSNTTTSNNLAKYEQTGELSRNRYEPRNLEELKDYAKVIIQSGLCPGHIQKPADALLVMQRGAEMGLTAVNSLQNMFVISGKVSMSAQLAVGICKASPLCQYFQCIEYEVGHVTWETQRVGNPNPTRITFTKDDAQKAGLWGKGMWSKYPQNMMSARASINLARMEYSDLLAGIYTPDELGNDSPDVSQAPKMSKRPSTVERLEDNVVDAEFEDAPAPKRAKAAPARKSMRGDSKSKQAAQHDAIRNSERADAQDLVLEGESVSEKKAWTTLNAAIHAQAKGLNDVWYRAFHDYITEKVGAANWKALTVAQLEMVLARFKSVGDPVDWIKEVCRGSIATPDFADASAGWAAVSELIHGVTKSNAEKFEKFSGSICAQYDAAYPATLTVEQLQDVWRELATLKAIAPNGGKGGEISEREAWLVDQVARIKQKDLERFAAEQRSVSAPVDSNDYGPGDFDVDYGFEDPSYVEG